MVMLSGRKEREVEGSIRALSKKRAPCYLEDVLTDMKVNE